MPSSPQKSHEVLFHAKAEVVGTDQFKARVLLFEQDREYQITMHRHYLEANDLFQIGRWFDFRVVRVDGLVDLELSRRPDLEDNKWAQKVKRDST